ncbi:MAG: hydrogenase [Candidatus Omnitrophota bacterium]
MSSWADLLIISVVLVNLLIAASGRISTCIQLVAVQGIMAGFLTLIVKSSHTLLTVNNALVETTVFSLVSIILKGFVFPQLLFRAQREADVQKEVEPLVGYPLSMMICLAVFLVSFWLSRRLPLPAAVFSPWVVPVAFSTILTGMFIIVSRVKALTQVLGYLVLENGIYIFGIALLVEQPLLVESAILLDLFVAVFVMGIAIFHISREFDHIDTQYLSQLKDWMGTRQERRE